MTAFHPTLRRIVMLGMAASFVCTLVGGCRPSSPPGVAAQAQVVMRPLDLAWSFASAIDNDPDDRAIGQAKVAEAWLEDGDRRMAVALARTINGWTRGAVLARAAEQAVRAGEVAEGTALAAEAEGTVSAVADWPRDRVRMLLAPTAVLLEATNTVERLAARYGQDKEYSGQIAAAQALQLAREERYGDALQLLDGLVVSNEFDKGIGRTQGYGLLAEAAAPSQPDVALAVLERMWTSAAQVPGLRGYELRLDVVDAATKYRLARAATARLAQADGVIMAASDPPHVLLPAQLRLARTWAEAGKSQRAADIVKAVLPACRESVMEIERPALLASAARTMGRAGDRAKADVLFREAIHGASVLKNRRPRCLAFCEIALELHRATLPDGIPLSLLREQAKLLEER
jgi:hypothetical protein